MEKHRKGQHFGELTYTCNYCDYKGSTPGDVVAHKKKEHKECKTAKIVCHLCGNSYKPHYFDAHMKNVHLGQQKMVMCDLCGKTMAENTLRSHKSNMHFRFLICTIAGILVMHACFVNY